MHTSAGAPTPSVPGLDAEDAAPVARVMRASASGSAMPVLRAPISASAAAAARARWRPARPRRTAPACRRRRPARGRSTRGRSCRPRAPRAARRGRVCRAAAVSGGLRIEPADVDVAQVQVMHGDVAGDRQALALRGPHHRHAFGGREPAQVDATPVSRTSARIVASAMVSAARGNRRQAEARRDLAVVRDAAAREMRVLRRAARRGDRTSRAYCIARSSTRVSASGASACENATHPASASSPISVSSTPARPHGQRADRIDVRLVERARAVLQHLDQPGLVERRIGVRRTREARHAAGDRRLHFGFERRLVLEARLAQPRGEIDESGRRRQSRARRSCGPAASPTAPRSIASDPAVGDVERTRRDRCRAPDRSTRPWLISIFIASGSRR